MGTGGSIPGQNRPGHEADSLRPSNAQVKDRGAVPTLPQATSWRCALFRHSKEQLQPFTSFVVYPRHSQALRVCPLCCGHEAQCSVTQELCSAGLPTPGVAHPARDEWKVGKETTVTILEAMSRHSPRGAEENHESPQYLHI